jgi:hypothetical protein
LRSDADQNEDAGHGVVVEMLLKAGCDPAAQNQVRQATAVVTRPT